MNQRDDDEIVPQQNKVSVSIDADDGNLVIVRHALPSGAFDPMAEEDVLVVIPRAYVGAFAARVAGLVTEEGGA